ncbi:stage II sporulation protein M [Nanoarchaeota archaeon]
MVIERLLDKKPIMQRPWLAFGLGFLFSIIGFIVARFFFKESISVAMLFMTTLILVPSIIKLISIEEKRVRHDGIKRFFHDHKDIYEIYFFLFLGIFMSYLVMGIYVYNTDEFDVAFNFQQDFLEKQQGVTEETLKDFKEKEINPTINNFLGILSNNLSVALICFALSLFYGAGAIFLMMLNASVFSTFILMVIKHASKTIFHAFSVIGIFFIHLLPELGGFLLAAIAGGIISKALLVEKIGSTSFKNVMKDATVLLLVSFGMIIVGAALEVFVTTRLMHWFL